MVTQSLQDAPRRPLCHRAIRCLQEREELLAAKTEHRLTGPAMAAQQGRDVPQGEVARRVPILVVRALEVVEIEHQGHHLLAVPLRLGVTSLELLLEAMTQRQAGQCVQSRAVRKVLGLQERKTGNDGGPGAFEVIQFAGVTGSACEDPSANAARGVMHLTMVLAQVPDRGLVELIKEFAVAAQPVAQSTVLVGFFRKHSVAGRGAQNRAAQHPVRPCKVALRGFVETLDEVLRDVVEGYVWHGEMMAEYATVRGFRVGRHLAPEPSCSPFVTAGGGVNWSMRFRLARYFNCLAS